MGGIRGNECIAICIIISGFNSHNAGRPDGMWNGIRVVKQGQGSPFISPTRPAALSYCVIIVRVRKCLQESRPIR